MVREEFPMFMGMNLFQVNGLESRTRVPHVHGDLLFLGFCVGFAVYGIALAWLRGLCLNSVDGIVLAAHCTSMMFTP